MAQDEERPVEIETNDARAGSTPHVTRYVLGISLVLVVVIFLILFWR